jgi:EmrB/QacA subfamily drug resistance transporter
MPGTSYLPCDDGVIRGAKDPMRSTGAGTWVLVATILGSSMVFIDGTVVNVALPALQVGLNATVTDVQWVVESYALFLAALLLVGGSLGDLYGRRKVFTVGTVLFAGASCWCGLAGTVGQLIVARGVQGIGGALLVPGSLALISSSFCEEERGQAIGTWSGFTAMTASFGPVLGGWLIQHLSWRWAFFINLPLAAVVVLVTVARVPESKAEGVEQRLDWWGAVLATIGLCGVTFALIEAGGNALRAWVAAGVGVAALMGFFVVERRSAAPMLPLELFRSRTFSGANLLTLLLYAAISSVMFFLPLDLIEVQHYSPTEAGAALLPTILLIFLLSRWSGGLIVRYGAKLPLMVGPMIAAVGFALFTRAGGMGSYWSEVFPAVVVLGIGMAVSVAPLTTAVMNSVDQGRTGVASGVNNAVSRVGGLLAIAVMGFVFSVAFDRKLDRGLDALSLPVAERQQVESQREKRAAAETSDFRVRRLLDESFVASYDVVLWLALGLSVASALSAAWLIEARTKLGDGRADLA